MKKLAPIRMELNLNVSPLGLIMEFAICFLMVEVYVVLIVHVVLFHFPIAIALLVLLLNKSDNRKLLKVLNGRLVFFSIVEHHQCPLKLFEFSGALVMFFFDHPNPSPGCEKLTTEPLGKAEKKNER